MVDLIKFVHGSKRSIQKLVREFRELSTAPPPSQQPIARPDNRVTEEPQPMETENAPPTTARPNYSTISKRQLEAKIREIAVYESRPELHKGKLWYVGMETLLKYRLTSLPVPGPSNNSAATTGAKSNKV